MTIANRMALTPSVEVGIRQDGGDAEVGRGLDLGLGLVLADGVAGLAVDVGVLRLLVHGAERRLGARRRARQGRGDADAVERLVGAADGRGDHGDDRESGSAAASAAGAAQAQDGMHVEERWQAPRRPGFAGRFAERELRLTPTAAIRASPTSGCARAWREGSDDASR